MKKTFLILTLLAAAVLNAQASAQVASQVTTPNATVTTTVQSPTETTITKVTTNNAQSTITKLRDGNRMEVDSDGSVYMVYPDGARVTATDGMHMLIDGTTVTVKDGKRIP